MLLVKKRRDPPGWLSSNVIDLSTVWNNGDGTDRPLAAISSPTNLQSQEPALTNKASGAPRAVVNKLGKESKGGCHCGLEVGRAGRFSRSDVALLNYSMRLSIILAVSALATTNADTLRHVSCLLLA